MYYTNNCRRNRYRRSVIPSVRHSTLSTSAYHCDFCTRMTLFMTILLSLLLSLTNHNCMIKAVPSTNQATISPFLLGLRSAMAKSGTVQRILQQTTTTNTSSHQSANLRRYCKLSGTNDVHEQHCAEYAMFRPNSLHEAKEFLSTETAHIRKTTLRRSQIDIDSIKSKNDELVFLEASLQPSLLRDVQYVDNRNEKPDSGKRWTRTKSLTPTSQGSTKKRRDKTQDVRPLVFWESMVCGAISRSVAQTTMHPANTMKTLLQNNANANVRELLLPKNLPRLWIGAGSNFLLSVPHGAVNFAVLEFVRKRLSTWIQRQPKLAAREQQWGPGLDFLSSAISTVACSVVSTPQMMINDNIMAGNYVNLPSAVVGLARNKGVVMGFYAGWWPGLVGKIPSYALTWTFYQQIRRIRDRISHRSATDYENSAMACLASAGSVCLMIPMDTIKTRLVTQAGRTASESAYKGIVDCAIRVLREEGIGAFYRGLPPRLVSVVPMIGIQFGVYEFMKKTMIKRRGTICKPPLEALQGLVFNAVLEEAMMEVAASPEHPFPAPRFLQRFFICNESKIR